MHSAPRKPTDNLSWGFPGIALVVSVAMLGIAFTQHSSGFAIPALILAAWPIITGPLVFRILGAFLCIPALAYALIHG